MEPASIAEQRATAVAMLKRAASLPRMKDGRRPPMHPEAVSEGEQIDKPDDESAQGSDDKPDTPESLHVDVAPRMESDAAEAEVEAERVEEHERDEHPEAETAHSKSPEVPPTDGTPERPSTPARKRRSRSRARSRGSKDLRLKTKTPPPVNNESSADEYAPDEQPPSPPLISPIPSHFANLQASRFLRSPISPVPGMFYPITSPSTPMMPPSLDDIQKNIGLFRSNSVGAARMMAMSKLTGEPVESFQPSSTPLGRNNTVSGGERGERVAARRMLFNKLRRPEKTDADQTSGTDDPSRPATPARQRKRHSRRSSSRASTVLDDRDDREQTSTSPTTPIVPPSPLPPRLQAVALALAASTDSNRTPVQHQQPDVSMPMGGRGVVIEDEDEDADKLAVDKSSDARSQLSNDSLSAVPVPFFLSTQSASKQDGFPASPWETPLREKQYLDEDEESDAYRELRINAGSRQAFPRDSEISWIAEPVPMSRMPINDDEEEEDEGSVHPADDEGEVEAEVGEPILEVHEPEPHLEEPEERPSDDQSSQSYYPASPSASGASKDLLIEIETSPELSPHVPPSPSSAIVLSYGSRNTAPTPAPPSPGVYPRRLSVTTPVQQQEPSPLATEFQEWDGNQTDTTPKRGNEGQSAWERVKGAFVRSNSSGGRRSRTNSIGRRYNTDSSVSRESGLSQSSATKGDRSSVVATPAPGLMQSPSASASILSLAPPPGGVSPGPPMTSADYAKYQDSKLFPFPGIKQLEEKRKQAKGIGSASSPDIFSPNAIEAQASSSSSSSGATKVPDGPRDRKLSHQASDTKLLAKFSNGASPLTSAPSTGSHADYFSLNSANAATSPGLSSGLGSLKLPTTLPGVRKWLTTKKTFAPQSPGPSAPSTPAAASIRLPPPLKKPSLSDLGRIVNEREHELSDWEDVGSDKSRTPVSPLVTKRLDDQYPGRVPVEVSEHAKDDRKAEGAQSPRVAHTNGSAEVPALPSPPEPPSSATPEPLSSQDEDPAPSTSESFSSDISYPNSPAMGARDATRAAVIIERLEEALGRGSKGSIWPISIDDPPRKLILSSPVLQVANANTVKDRFLFIFSDILVIAKPILPDPNEFLDTSKPSVYERRFIVKNVASLRDLKFCADRDDSRARTSLNASHMRHQVVRTFVHQFAKDPDMAITTLFDRSNMRVDPIALGQLLFRATELDRTRLGEYLARRTSKVVLKAYLDCFGFRSMRIDKALRAFLLSISIPPKASLEHLMDAFASRWYEANSDLVVYDREVAIRLVRSIIQLNEVMHGGISQNPGFTPYPKRNVIGRDFIDAFHRTDPRCYAVTAESLDRVYAAIRRERLSQARSTQGGGSADLMISIKRPIPSRLTYRVQSEPIILRIPQPDEHLTIQLFGDGLQIDPPYFTFAKSAEASFRLTATALGPKNVVMWRSGPHALLYSGLPFSSPIGVERAFMRNTFQVAFRNHEGEKRRYMFSVDDSVKHRSLIDTLRQQIDITSQPAQRSAVEISSPSFLKVRKAVEAVAFQVLQEALMSPEDSSHEEQFPSAVDDALARLTGSTSPYGNGYLNATPSNLHRRSKSRSQVYHRHGAGKLEPDFTDSDRDDGLLQRDASLSQRPGGNLWTTNDLEVVCRQNSSLPQVLAYLHVEGADGAVS